MSYSDVNGNWSELLANGRRWSVWSVSPDTLLEGKDAFIRRCCSGAEWSSLPHECEYFIHAILIAVLNVFIGTDGRAL